MKTLNDKLMLTDILAHLRDLMNAGGRAIQHSNCPKMRTVVETCTKRLTEHQFAVFLYMHNNGMYPVQNVGDKEIQTALDTHCGKGLKPK